MYGVRVTPSMATVFAGFFLDSHESLVCVLQRVAGSLSV